MDQETQKIIDEQLKSLPADVKAAIVSVDYKTKLQEITKRQKLLIDQAAKLEMETTLVMIGLEPLPDYINNLQREMELTPVRAKEVAMDVSENIFKPIRASLQMMGQEENKEEIEVPLESKFTNSNEPELNRDQILREIENPSLIKEGQQSMLTKPINPNQTIEIRPAQNLEIVPIKIVNDNSPKIEQDITSHTAETKLIKPSLVSQEIVEIKSENKLPEVKKRPTSGIDPYREPLI